MPTSASDRAAPFAAARDVEGEGDRARDPSGRAFVTRYRAPPEKSTARVLSRDPRFRLRRALGGTQAPSPGAQM
jgi:hypothetical protein